MTIVRAAGIESSETVNWGVLRHAAASPLIKPGVDIFTVSRRMGPQQGEFHDGRLWAPRVGQQRAAAEALDHLLASG